LPQILSNSIDAKAFQVPQRNTQSEWQPPTETANPKRTFPIDGFPPFCLAPARLLLGDDSPAVKEKRLEVAQTLSGTGALRIAAEFLRAFFHRRQITPY